ncbi:MAG: SUMF1/EgtB/PvdO family nonheme iron enzyme [Candidatus Latescibacteria bacterium]|nr:SUMF1/EgtB/PvdO family nonheme iron enzyme [Candidatus Latescibacterota bacterium]
MENFCTQFNESGPDRRRDALKLYMLSLTVLALAACSNPFSSDDPAPVGLDEAVLQEPDPAPLQTGDERFFPLPGGASMAFIWIEAGSFAMGDWVGAAGADCIPRHRVEITRGFWLGKYEITQAQWVSVLGIYPSTRVGDDLPVEEVSWSDVQEYIRHINQAEGQIRYRLPTEAEWEYAARGGTTTTWPFGDNEALLDEYAHRLVEAGFNGMLPVGSKKPNPWGLHDMIGNVSEWIQDWYAFDYYVHTPLVDPPGPQIGWGRVLRGGSYNFAQSESLTPAWRGYDWPSNRETGTGARLVRIP